MLENIGDSRTRSFVATVPKCNPQLAHSVKNPLADTLPLSRSHNLPAKPASNCYQVPLAMSMLIWMPAGGSSALRQQAAG